MKKYIFENIKNVLLGALLVSTSTTATAATTGNFSIGASYFSMGMIDRVSTSSDGKANLMGSTFLPFQFAYYTSAFGYGFSPKLLMTLLPQKSKGGGVDEGFYALYFPISPMMSGAGWGWSTGPGVFMYNLKGEGGTATLNNGTGTAQFAKPGSTVSSKLIFWGAGVDKTWGLIRMDADFWIMAPMSSKKRSYNLNLAFSYLF